jgi:SAM-dependent MidA family methyltransferase
MVPWRIAVERALYGPAGFYRTGAGPAAHFRTSVHASSLFGKSMAQLVCEVDDLLGLPASLDVVDVGAGGGELLVSIYQQLPETTRPRVNLVGVELRPRPQGLPGAIDWRDDLPEHVDGLLLANEWLDNVPFDVVQSTSTGLRETLVDEASGDEQPGDLASPAQVAWVEKWWPFPDKSSEARAEVGILRDDAWCGAFARLGRGAAVAIDYSHSRDLRAAGHYSGGTVAAFRDGRAVRPVPDGTCDITAHVALDACAAATSGATETLLTTQRAALHALGISGARPAIALSGTDPAGYLTALVVAGESGELVDPAGLGAFGWLVQTRGVPLPPSLRSLAPSDEAPR